MGRGRGQGSHAETSRTQGRVYAIVPLTGPAGKPTLRVCFYYLAYGKEYYLILGHHIPSLLHHV